MSAELDLYKILGVEKNASDAEIKKVNRQHRSVDAKNISFMLFLHRRFFFYNL